MQHYYKNAILSIAVHVSAGDEEGFLGYMRNNSQGQFDTKEISPCESHINIRHPITIPRLAGDTCLSRRAWTLQEDILSSRTLHYTKEQIIWECQTSKYCESDASELGDDHHYLVSGLKRFFLAPHVGAKKYDNSYAGLFDPIYRWYSILESYDFTRGVLWTSVGVAEATQQYRAPSWSLLALNFSRKEFRESHVFPLRRMKDANLLEIRRAKLLEWHIDTADGDLLGRLKSGYLRIRGASLPASQWRGKVPPHFNQQDLVSFKSWIYESDNLLPNQLICVLHITPKHLFVHRSNTASRLTELGGEWDYLLDENVAQAQLLDVTILQITTVSGAPYSIDVSMALMLRANEDGTAYRRVGIVEVPNYGYLAEFGWETRDFTIV
ncbi:uncharacterized protein BP5553_08816 [Venustampulla echinocandica]|uniref:Heterokaryon incompatibility domain-containing protein n=1 Tax=Venustampulla echinocandica TaxID=2656787 RepID=A0A370TD19_9HELO|nr:uncharacterized protein BP5553_08816 [Venustampulla echinocandica]RDL32360.1 hypothetical protein BP5553_08816 [Venustampulla echinocandica]